MKQTNLQKNKILKKKKMKIINTTKIIRSLEKSKQKFSVIETTLSSTIICKYGTFKFNRHTELKKNELGFIKQVFEHCDKFPKNQIKNIDSFKNQIRYVDTQSKIKFTELENCYEIDINSAYWNLAHNKGYISKEIFDKGNSEKISKLARLISLGNLAKVKYLFYFNSNEYTLEDSHKSDMEYIFFDCCNENSKLMQDLKFLSETFLFFWVDAIFIKNEKDFKNICEYLDFKNIPYKVKQNLKIQNLNNSFKVTEIKDCGKIKERNFSKPNFLKSHLNLSKQYAVKKEIYAIKKNQY